MSHCTHTLHVCTVSVTPYSAFKQRSGNQICSYRDITLSDNLHHSSLGPFRVMDGSAALTATPADRQSGSTHFIPMLWNQPNAFTRDLRITAWLCLFQSEFSGEGDLVASLSSSVPYLPPDMHPTAAYVFLLFSTLLALPQELVSEGSSYTRCDQSS